MKLIICGNISLFVSKMWQGSQFLPTCVTCRSIPTEKYIYLLNFLFCFPIVGPIKMLEAFFVFCFVWNSWLWSKKRKKFKIKWLLLDGSGNLPKSCLPQAWLQALIQSIFCCHIDFYFEHFNSFEKTDTLDCICRMFKFPWLESLTSLKN